MTALKVNQLETSASVCRCCLADCSYKTLTSEYFWIGKREVYSEMMAEAFNINISYSTEEDAIKNRCFICELCISRLRDAAEFKQQILICKKKYVEHIQKTLEETEHLVSLGEVPVEFIKKEKKHTKEDPFTDNEDNLNNVITSAKSETFSSKGFKRELAERHVFKKPKKPVPDKRKSLTVLHLSKAKKHKCKKHKHEKILKTKKSLKTLKSKLIKKKATTSPKRDTSRLNAMIILKYSTAYPFQQTRTSLRCCYCRENFTDSDDFRTHMDSKHLKKNVLIATKHPNNAMTRADISNLKCSICLEAFDDIPSIAQHLHDVHKFAIKLEHSLGLIPIKLVKDKYACTICGKIHLSLQHLSRHTGSHFATKICESCGQSFETLHALKVHIRYSHAKTIFFCRICRRQFPTTEARQEHIDTNRCFNSPCQICGERFSNSDMRQHHQEKVHGMPKVLFPCNACGEIFNNRTQRYLHFKSTHTDDHKCKLCEKKFPTQRYLEDHVARAHTGERAYKCSVCGKSFLSSKDLRKHEHIHSKDEACPVCNRLFAIKFKLKEHMKARHPVDFTLHFPDKGTI